MEATMDKVPNNLQKLQPVQKIFEKEHFLLKIEQIYADARDKPNTR